MKNYKFLGLLSIISIISATFMTLGVLSIVLYVLGFLLIPIYTRIIDEDEKEDEIREIKGKKYKIYKRNFLFGWEVKREVK